MSMMKTLARNIKDLFGVVGYNSAEDGTGQRY